MGYVSGVAVSWNVIGRRFSLDPLLLWLWRRTAGAALIFDPAGVAEKRKKKLLKSGKSA